MASSSSKPRKRKLSGRKLISSQQDGPLLIELSQPVKVVLEGSTETPEASLAPQSKGGWLFVLMSWVLASTRGLFRNVLFPAAVAITFVLGSVIRQTTLTSPIPASFGEFTIRYPTYLAAGDQGDITITFKSTQVITDVKALLQYNGALPLRANVKQSTIATFGDMEEGETKTQQVSIVVERSPLWTQFLDLSARVWAANGSPESLGTIWIQVLPWVPRVKSYFASLGVLMSGAIAVVINEWLKKRVLPSGKK